MENQFKVVNLEAEMGEGGLALKDEEENGFDGAGPPDLGQELASAVAQFPMKEEKVEEEEAQLPPPWHVECLLVFPNLNDVGTLVV
eukprot:1867848-Heterocapsa_arctica.AAC.1